MDTNGNGYVSLIELAPQLGMDRSNARKYVIKQGFAFIQLRGSKDQGYQKVLVLTNEDAETVIALRKSQGFGADQAISALPATSYFYVVQIVPDLDPLRVKMGFAVDPSQRLQNYQTLSPTAQIAKVWVCKPQWERTAMDSITREGCQCLGGEVYECDGIDQIVQRGDEFFALMPTFP